MESQGLPTSIMYTIQNGQLVQTPRFGEHGSDKPLPENYALVYSKNVGKPGSPDMMAKVFIIRNGDRKIKEFYSTKFDNNPKYLRQMVEIYISNQLRSPSGSSQSLLQIDRKSKKVKKSKIKRCKCK